MHRLVMLGLLLVTMATASIKSKNDDYTVFPMDIKLTTGQTDNVTKCLEVTNNPKTALGSYGPVCGSDGYRYWNKKIWSCFKDLPQMPKEKDSAQMCKDRPIWAPLATRRNWWVAKNEDVEAVENCAHKCEEKFNPVCGTDNKTYSHSCELQCAGSKFPSIREASKGFCKQDMAATEGECAPIWQPVCGTNGITYLNMCHLRFAKKRQQMPVNYHHMGDCVLRPIFVKTECLKNGCNDDLYKRVASVGSEGPGGAGSGGQSGSGCDNDIPMGDDEGEEGEEGEEGKEAYEEGEEGEEGGNEIDDWVMNI